MHPFADGNKRTALLTTVYYLKLEKYSIALPLSAVRYTVNIAKNNKTDSVSTMKLINEIANWINMHSGTRRTDALGKLGLYIYIPYKFLAFLSKIGFKGYVIKKVAYWLALDIYPEYATDIVKIIDFIDDTISASFSIFEI